jgi:hypothetical protein
MIFLGPYFILNHGILGFCSPFSNIMNYIFYPIILFQLHSSGGALLLQIGVFVAKMILSCLQLVDYPLISIRSLMLIILAHVESISHLHPAPQSTPLSQKLPGMPQFSVTSLCQIWRHKIEFFENGQSLLFLGKRRNRMFGPTGVESPHGQI